MARLLNAEELGLEFVSVDWFTPLAGDCIGIVTVRDTRTGEEKSYIGTGFGKSEDEDIHHITITGAKFRK